MTVVVERFAPSPTGLLHLGHAFSALIARAGAREAGGRFLLRLEDLDRGRVRAEFSEAIFADLAWLGVNWDGEVLVQSERLETYASALDHLDEMGLTYRCGCTRRDIAAAVSAPQEGVRTYGPDGLVYPGTCREAQPPPESDTALRLDMRRALSLLGMDVVAALRFTETGAGPTGQTGSIGLDPAVLLSQVGDVVLRRKDGMPAYHLAVVVDDAVQGVSIVTRGEDLFSSTPFHRLLQALLKLPTPRYRHHRLIRDKEGRRLAKRADATSLRRLREEGWQPDDVRRAVGLL